MFDYTKTPKRLLVELINEDNEIALNPDFVVFNLPAVVTDDTPIRNTTISVSGTPDSAYIGSRELFYNRVPVAGFIGTLDLSFPRGTAQTIQDIIPQINQLLNINLTPADYIDGDLPPIPLNPDQGVSVNILMHQHSLVYLGGLDIILIGDEVDLAAVFTVTELAGFFIDPSQVIN